MKKMVKYLPLSLLNRFEAQILKDPEKIRHILRNKDSEFLEEIGKKKALAAFKRACKVPAYKKFIKEHRVNCRRVTNIEYFDGIVPITTKKNYVKKYSYEERCIGGKFPTSGNIDESSGSTGVPTNWIRSLKEEDKLVKTMKFGFKYLFNLDENTLIISCWSSGAWATGVKFCEIVEKFALVKNVGTDIEKAIQTIKTFGKKYRYIITGYPLFVKELLETKGLTWKNFDISIITGGDGVATGWDEYIQKLLGRKATIISAYGSSDIDIGVGHETPMTKDIRDACTKDPKLCQALFKDVRVPMVFQYNPLMYYIQNKIINKKREFVTTALGENVAAPKIKYALHDEGGRIRYKEMIEQLRKRGIEVNEDLRLPFLYIFGRSDGTISLDGANVYPIQVERAIMSNEKTVKKISSIMIEKKIDKKHNANFIVHVELRRGTKKTANLKRFLQRTIINRLTELNADYKESLANNRKLKPKVILYNKGKGPFCEDAKRLKHKYIIEHEN